MEKMIVEETKYATDLGEKEKVLCKHKKKKINRNDKEIRIVGEKISISSTNTIIQPIIHLSISV